MKTRILVVDDQLVVFEGIQAAFSKYDDVEILGLCSDGQAAVERSDSLRPDIVIMDITLTDFNGVEVTHLIRRIDPEIKVIIFSTDSYQEFLLELIKAGVSGYVLKQAPLSDLYLAIQVVKRGGTYFGEDIYTFLARNIERFMDVERIPNPMDLLSKRERQIFHLMAEGFSVKETAKRLCISPKTVETHKYHIMDKLQLRSMIQWTKEAIRRGVVEI